MNDKYFIDTNVFVYSFDSQETSKKARSLELIENALKTGDGLISTQIIQEFLNVATRKFAVPMKLEDSQTYLRKVLNPLCQVYPDLPLYDNCLLIQSETGYSFYDSLIMAAAIRGGCNILYSEDLQAGHRVQNVTIANPYTEP